MPEVLELTANPRSGRVRRTICAMLFAAMLINYMDRQVIGLLKTTLERNIGLTELSLGYIIAAFQAAYAIGLLAAASGADRWSSRHGPGRRGQGSSGHAQLHLFFIAGSVICWRFSSCERWRRNSTA